MDATAPCPRCGAPVGARQDWCLNCGLAVTSEVSGAPGWRTPIAVAAAVGVLALVGLGLAFLQLSDDADRVAANLPAEPSPAAAAPPAPQPAPSAPTGPTGPRPAPSPTPGLAMWPADETAFTVILYSGRNRRLAEAKARSLDSIEDIGLLRSTEYTSLRPGLWVVFSGQYDTLQAAQAAAEGVQATAPGAYPKRVVPQ